MPPLAAVDLTPADPSLPVLVVGPSLGAAVETVWSACAAALAGHYHLVGWDLPGHGRSEPARGPFTIVDLAEGVWAVVTSTLGRRGDPDGAVHYAGDSIGGAVGLQLLLDRPAWRVVRPTPLFTRGPDGTPPRRGGGGGQGRGPGKTAPPPPPPPRRVG